MPEFGRILITGAAGELGARLRTGLAHLVTRIRLADVKDMGAAAAHEEVVVCDLSDKDAALAVTRDCDAIVHFAGHPREQTFEEILRDTLRCYDHGAIEEGALTAFNIVLDQFHAAVADRKAVLFTMPQNPQRTGPQFRAAGNA